MKKYVVCTYDTKIEVAGPFLDDEQLGLWGRWWQKEHGDDPRWQEVSLSDGDFAGLPSFMKVTPHHIVNGVKPYVIVNVRGLLQLKGPFDKPVDAHRWAEDRSSSMVVILDDDHTHKLFPCD